jgi:putative PEP-CTERM system histidine kinase
VVGDDSFKQRVRFVELLSYALIVAAALMVVSPYEAGKVLDMDSTQVRKSILILGLMIALGGLLLTEQLFRSTARSSRWALKHLCFGIGSFFAYDFYLYADAVLFNLVDPVLWSSRGVINAMAVPMIAISAARNREWNLNLFVSRRVVFHGVTLVGAGAYLMAMAAAGYYIQIFGGEWGNAVKTAFFCAAILVLLSLFFSVQLRSRLRLFLAKHFYRNKYEYGEEWLNFTQRLAQTSLDPGSLNRTILSAVADIIDSPGGIVWRKTLSNNFAVAATTSMYDDCDVEIDGSDPFVAELEQSAAVRDLTDDAEIESTRGSTIPEWLLDLQRVALILPIIHSDELLAFIVLARPRTNERLDWEDVDLLATVGRQVASYYALIRATDALMEARQFETFNRLSAFLVHDLKNVVAQLSLIESNAKIHGKNPEFVEDALVTVGDAVARMNRMLANLRQMRSEVQADDVVDIRDVVREAVERKSEETPAPTLSEPGRPLKVRAGRDRLQSIVEHLLQNAIEATAADGSVDVSIDEDNGNARITIADTGCGMERDFINNRLFKPFDTTKGKAGMGIGAYESRHVVSSMNGELLVDSTPGKGTTFTIVLPRAREVGEDAAELAAQGG